MTKDFFKDNKVFLIAFGSLFALCIIMIAIIAPIANKNKPDNTRDTNSIQIYHEVINDINWEIKYDQKKEEIVSISAKTQESERQSKYWEELANRHGDHAISMQHTVVLNGEPTKEDGWFKITKQEKYYFDTEVFYDATTRYEEQFNITAVPSYSK